MTLAPIVLFVYDRLDHTKQTLEALQQNQLAKDSELFIYSDASKNDKSSLHVKNVRDYIQTIDGFKKVTIIERDQNWGLANSIIDGVTSIVNQYGKIIVLEDDLVTSPYFLKFMNESLDMYKNELQVASIHGYIYPINGLPDTFFIRGSDCWGWATWSDRWKIFEPDGQKLFDELKKRKLQREADFNSSYAYTKMLKDQIKGKNSSWAIRWYISAFLKDMLTLYPGQSYVQNIGLDGMGTHCGVTDVYNVNLTMNENFEKIVVIESKEAKMKIEHYFRSIKRSLVQKVWAIIVRKINA